MLAPTMLFAMDLDKLNSYADKNLVRVGQGCSGTIVDPGSKIVLTAYHCIASAVKQVEEEEKDQDGNPILDEKDTPKKKKKTEVKKVPVSQIFYEEDSGDPEYLTYGAEIIARDQKLDVAILRLDTRVGPVDIPLQSDVLTIPLASQDYKYVRGSTVWHVGNPIMKYGSITKGIISSYRDIRDDLKDYFDNKSMIQYDGGLAGGSSGGALYDDNGVYIGTAVAHYMDRGVPAHFMGLFTPMTDFYTVAEKNCIQLGGLVLPEKCSEDKKAK